MGVGLGVKVEVGEGVMVGVNVGVGEGVIVGVNVRVGVYVAVGVGVAVAKIPEIAPHPVRFNSTEINNPTKTCSFQLFFQFNSAFMTPSLFILR